MRFRDAPPPPPPSSYPSHLSSLPPITPVSPLSPFRRTSRISSRGTIPQTPNRDDTLSPSNDARSARSSVTGVSGNTPEQVEGQITTAYVAARSSADLIRVVDLTPQRVAMVDGREGLASPREATPTPTPAPKPQLAPAVTITSGPKRSLLSSKKTTDASSSAPSEPFSIATVPSVIVPMGPENQMPTNRYVWPIHPSISTSTRHRRASSDLSSLGRRSQVVPVDQSFLRMSQAYSEYSDNGSQVSFDPRRSSRPSSFWASSTQASGDTFGTRRRQSLGTSVADDTFSDAHEVVGGAPHSTKAVSEDGSLDEYGSKRRSHKFETDAAITAQLIQAAVKNDHRIWPQTAPPTSGTTLLHGLVEESSERSASPASLLRRASSRRTTSKVDQVLGRGAQAAADASSSERKAFQTALESSIIPRS